MSEKAEVILFKKVPAAQAYFTAYTEAPGRDRGQAFASVAFQLSQEISGLLQTDETLTEREVMQLGPSFDQLVRQMDVVFAAGHASRSTIEAAWSGFKKSIEDDLVAVGDAARKARAVFGVSLGAAAAVGIGLLFVFLFAKFK